jgi:hypothetical protein
MGSNPTVVEMFLLLEIVNMLQVADSVIIIIIISNT